MKKLANSPQLNTSFKIIKSMRQFQNLVNSQVSFQITLCSENRQIIIPQYEQISKNIPSKGKYSPSYIRLPKQLNIPLNDSYEIDELDSHFIMMITTQYCGAFNEEVFKQCIISLEKYYYSRERKYLTLQESLLSKLKEYIGVRKGQEHHLKIAQIIYNFWLEKRSVHYRCPLLRRFWSSSQFMPFKARTEAKSIKNNSSKKKAINDRQIQQYKYKDLLKLREMLKLLVEREKKIQQVNAIHIIQFNQYNYAYWKKQQQNKGYERVCEDSTAIKKTNKFQRISQQSVKKSQSVIQDLDEIGQFSENSRVSAKSRKIKNTKVSSKKGIK